MQAGLCTQTGLSLLRMFIKCELGDQLSQAPASVTSKKRWTVTHHWKLNKPFFPFVLTLCKGRTKSRVHPESQETFKSNSHSS